jgi:hypothetical protein
VRGEPYTYCKAEKCTFKEAAPREKIWEQGQAPSAAPSPESPPAMEKIPSEPTPQTKASPGEGPKPGGADEQGNR